MRRVLTRIDPRDVRRVVIRCPNWLGDTVMALPAVRAVRAALPAAEIWCLGPWVESVMESEEGIGRRLPYPREWGARARLALSLRRFAIDLAIILPNSFESALHARLGGARWRVGYAGDARDVLLTHPVPPPGAPVHQIEAYLALLAPLGVQQGPRTPTIEISEARRAEARALLSGLGIAPGERVVGIQLGAAMGPAKLWPAGRLASLATWLGARDVAVVFLGTTAARPLLRAVENALGAAVRNLVGQDHPALLPALLETFTVLVAPDSGPAHVAAAVGVPGVTLFGPTDPRLTAPRGAQQRAIWRHPVCAPCFRARCPIDHRCMQAIRAGEVAAAVWERLAR